MLFERRAYTLRPGAAERYWDLQRQWNTPSQVAPFLQRCIGYFTTLAGPGEQVVHLYRYDSYDDWKTRLFGIYTPDRAEYFAEARKLLLAQENMFLSLAALSKASPLWGEGKDWLPGKPAFSTQGDLTGITVVETITDFVPGGLPLFLEAAKELLAADNAETAGHHIGTFTSLVGQQHRVLNYSWCKNSIEAEQAQRDLEAKSAVQKYNQSIRSHVVGRRVSFLKVAPISWMSGLFQEVKWA